MTSAVTHVWRLIGWGRTLARYGALRGLEGAPQTPPNVRRLLRLARFGTRQPRIPAYAAALEVIGPAAIKLGQALATRPDLIGPAAAHDLARLQDAVPALPFADIEAALDEAFEGRTAALFRHIDPVPAGAASIAQVHRATTSDGRDVAVKVLRPGIEGVLADALETYEWAAAKVEASGGEAARLRPTAVIASFRS